LRPRHLTACARSLLMLLGLAGGIWSGATLPAFRSAAAANDVTSRILAGSRFQSGTLGDVLASILASPAPLVQRSDLPRAEALVRLRILEEAIGRKDLDQVDRESATADARLKFALVLNPADSFLWLMLYSEEIAREGFAETTVTFLEQSYATGPLEAWIALYRNRLALAAFASLNETMQAKVVSEFAGLVESDFAEDATLNLMGVGWKRRDRLLASLANVNLIPREAFAKRLSREGLKVSVPGVELEDRLWR